MLQTLYMTPQTNIDLSSDISIMLPTLGVAEDYLQQYGCDCSRDIPGCKGQDGMSNRLCSVGDILSLCSIKKSCMTIHVHVYARLILGPQALVLECMYIHNIL